MTMLLAPAYGAGGSGGGGGGGSSFSASAFPLSAYGGVARATAVTVYAEDITVSTTGGVAPFTYEWNLVSGDAGTWSFTAPTGNATRVGRGSVSPPDSYSHVVNCTVTDATGATATTPNVDILVENFGELGGLLP